MPIIASLVGYIYNIQIHDVFSRLSFQHDHARSFGQSCYFFRMDNRTDRTRLLIPSRGRPRFSIRYCDHFQPDRRDPNSSQDIGNECDLICSIVFFESIRSQQDSGRMVWQIIQIPYAPGGRFLGPITTKRGICGSIPKDRKGK